MFYRVHAILAFTIPDEANDFYHDCQVALPKSETINPGELNEEKGTIILEKCFHDGQPTQPCEIVSQEATP